MNILLNSRFRTIQILFSDFRKVLNILRKEAYSTLQAESFNHFSQILRTIGSMIGSLNVTFENLSYKLEGCARAVSD